MIEMMTRLFTRAEPTLSEAGPRDAQAIAALHAAAFGRGWSEDEIERMLLDRHVVGHRAMLGAALAGFILSRLVAGEAEILSAIIIRPGPRFVIPRRDHARSRRSTSASPALPALA